MTDCASRVILGIDPGLANTGWGIVRQTGGHLACLAYGCISTSPNTDLSQRLRKIYDQMALIVQRYEPNCLGIETVEGTAATAEPEVSAAFAADGAAPAAPEVAAVALSVED